jgi:hypothetical protein
LITVYLRSRFSSFAADPTTSADEAKIAEPGGCKAGDLRHQLEVRFERNQEACSFAAGHNAMLASMREITGGVGKDDTVAEPFDMVPSVLAFRVDGLNTNRLTEIRKITGLGEYCSYHNQNWHSDCSCLLEPIAPSSGSTRMEQTHAPDIPFQDAAARSPRHHETAIARR